MLAPRTRYKAEAGVSLGSGDIHNVSRILCPVTQLHHFYKFYTAAVF